MIELNHEPIKRVKIKGLVQGEMAFSDYLKMIQEQAVSEWRLTMRRKVRRVALSPVGAPQTWF